MNFIQSKHTSDEPSIITGSDSGDKKIQPAKSLKTLLKVGLVLACVLVVAGGEWQYKQKSLSTDDVCTNNKTIMSKAAKAITDARASDLKDVADKVKMLENYDKDPNCLNIVATYYINISNYTDAKATVDKLVLVYDQQKGFSKDLGPKAYNLIALQQNVNALKQTHENFSKNIRGFGQPE